MSEKDVREVFIFNWLSSQPSCTSNSMLCMLCPAPCISTLPCDEATWGRGRAAQGTAAQHTICLSPAQGAALTRWPPGHLVRYILIWCFCHQEYQDIIMCWLWLVIIGRAGDGGGYITIAGAHAAIISEFTCRLPPPAPCLLPCVYIQSSGLGWAGLGGTLQQNCLVLFMILSPSVTFP